MTPDDVPVELQNLTFLEDVDMFDSSAHIHISRLQGGGQFSNKTMQLLSLAIDLSRIPSDVNILIGRKRGVENTHSDHKVLGNKLYTALVWLKQNNLYYANIIIIMILYKVYLSTAFQITRALLLMEL